MENQKKQCPFCGREVATDALKCLWCGKYFDSGKAEVTTPILPPWKDAKKISALVLVALVFSLMSTIFSFFEQDALIIMCCFAIIAEFICAVFITLSIRRYSSQFDYGKTIPFIAYLGTATIAIITTTVMTVVFVATGGDQDVWLATIIVSLIFAIIAGVMHILVALKLKNQNEVQPLKEYGRITVIASILCVVGALLPVVYFAAMILYSIFAYKIFSKFAKENELINKN